MRVMIIGGNEIGRSFMTPCQPELCFGYFAYFGYFGYFVDFWSACDTDFLWKPNYEADPKSTRSQ
jgi:hypothetical protein